MTEPDENRHAVVYRRMTCAVVQPLPKVMRRPTTSMFVDRESCLKAVNSFIEWRVRACVERQIATKDECEESLALDSAELLKDCKAKPLVAPKNENDAHASS